MGNVFYVFIIAYLLNTICCVKRHDFKTCDQSSFCKRNRNIKTDFSYIINSVDINYKTNVLSAIIVNENHLVNLKLNLYFIYSGIVRLTIKEENGLYARYTPKYALVDNPQIDSLKILNQTNEEIFVENNDLIVYIQYKPFRLYLKRNGTDIIILNSDNLLNFEHYRVKNSQPILNNNSNEESTEAPVTDSTDLWEETFNGHADSKPRGPSSIGLDVKFIGSRHVYGIPEHADSFALRDTTSGDPYRLYNLDVFEYELDNPMALYGSVPFMVSHSVAAGTCGVFWHNSAETWVDIVTQSSDSLLSKVSSYFSPGSADSVSKRVHWFSESGALDLFLLAGPSVTDVLLQYKSLTGATQLPPLFSLGYHQCRWNYNDEADVEMVHDTLDAHDFPFDVIWLDIEHAEDRKYFTWHPHKFAHPRNMVERCSKHTRKMVTIIDPHIKRSAGYFLHDEAIANDYYVRDAHNSSYDGWCWPGSSGYLDFHNERVQQFWMSLFSLDKYSGSTLDLYTWNDMNEPSVFNGPEITMPKDNLHASGTIEHREVHNEYGMLLPMSTARGQIYRSGGTRRPFVLTRAAFAGSQRFGAKWTGDNTASWPHLKISVPMLLSSSIAGISFIGADIGGFFGNPAPELLVRWYQMAALHPFARAHAHIDTARREPYLLDDAHAHCVRTALKKRYTLISYLYTLFFLNERTGMPPMRAIWMNYPKDASAMDIESVFMVGDDLLVSPQTDSGGQSVSVYLPDSGAAKQVWYDTDDWSKIYGPGPGYVTIATDLCKLPVLQRSGSILPLQLRPRRSTHALLHDPYTLVVALDPRNIESKASGYLYVDHGDGFQYKNNTHALLQYTYANGILLSRQVSGSGFQTRRWIERVIVLGYSGIPQSVDLVYNNRRLRLDYQVRSADRAVIIRRPGTQVVSDWSIVIY